MNFKNKMDNKNFKNKKLYLIIKSFFKINYYYEMILIYIFLLSNQKNEEFISTIKKDTWEDTLKISKSIRTLKGDKNFQAPDSIDLYSTLDKSKSLKYKDTLIKTKSVDRMIPFKHS